MDFEYKWVVIGVVLIILATAVPSVLEKRAAAECKTEMAKAGKSTEDILKICK